MATLLENIRSLFDRRKAPLVVGPYVNGELQPTPEPAGTTNPGDVFGSSTTVLTQRSGETDRIARYDLFDLMDTGDIEAMLDAVVDAAVTFEQEPGICFKLEGRTRTVTALTDMINYTELHHKLMQVIRDMIKYGDGFLELITDNDMIVRVQTYSPRYIYVNMDDRGTIDEGRAYVQYDSNGEEVAVWALNEMIHFKFQPSDRDRYSPKGLLDGIRADWENLVRMEAGLVIARTTRAYTRNVHLIDTTNRSSADSKRSLASYIRAVTRQEPTLQSDSQFNPVTRTDMAVNEDYFITTGYVQAPNGTLEPKKHDIKMLDPSIAGLGELADVEYARRKLFSRVPPDVVGIPSQYVDLTNQHISYARLIKRVQQSIERGLRFLFLQELLLLGVALDELNIIWPTTESGQSYRHQEGKYRQALTEQVQIESNLYSRKWILMHSHGHNEEEVLEIEKQIKEEKTALGAVFAPQSRAAQIGQGEASSETDTTPGPGTGPNADTNKAAQDTNGAGGSNNT